MNDVVNINEVGEISSELAHQVNDYVKASKAANTKKAIKNDWDTFTTWCLENGLQSLPASPKTVAGYLSSKADIYKVSTLRRHLSTISQAHEAAGVVNPLHSSLVKQTMKGIINTKGIAPKQKKATRTDDILRMIESMPKTLTGIRDKAILLLGFSGGFRRSELVALDVEDLEFKPEGVIITIRHSKTDQEGEGFKKAIRYGRSEDTCPVRALSEWLSSSNITNGAVFRSIRKGGKTLGDSLSDVAIALIVKKAAESVGLNPNEYAGHSLRAGLATEAAAAGAQDRDIMKMTGHKSSEMVHRYIREGNLFKNNVSELLGL